MPKEIQQQLYDHISQNLELVEKISQLHSNSADDIQFDNPSYQTLKTLLTKNYEKNTTR
jgi:hypothetical protein